jgi:hypothetical protein
VKARGGDGGVDPTAHRDDDASVTAHAAAVARGYCPCRTVFMPVDARSISFAVRSTASLYR